MKLGKQLYYDLKKTTLLEKVVASMGFVSFILAIYSSLLPITEDYHEWIIGIRDIILIVFFFFVAVVAYNRLSQKRNQLGFLNEHLDKVLEYAHNMTHVLRDNLCKLSCATQNYAKDHVDYEEQIKGRQDLPEEQKDLILAFFNSEIEKEEILTAFSDLEVEDLIRDVSSKREVMLEKLQSEVVRLGKNFLHQVTSDLKKQMEISLEASGFKEKISISVKQLKGKPTQRGKLTTEDLNDLTVITIFRDNETYMQKERDILDKEWSVGLNTTFKHCYEGTTRRNWCFVRNHLKQLYEQGLYQNQRSEFWKYYDSTIVVPIQDNKGKHANLYGFLTADCLNDSSDEILTFDRHFSIMAHAADAIAGFWKVVDFYLPDLFFTAHSCEI